MACESHMEGLLKNFAKQLEEQKATGLAKQIQSLDAQLAQVRNSYEKF